MWLLKTQILSGYKAPEVPPHLKHKYPHEETQEEQSLEETREKLQKNLHSFKDISPCWPHPVHHNLEPVGHKPSSLHQA